MEVRARALLLLVVATAASLTSALPTVSALHAGKTGPLFERVKAQLEAKRTALHNQVEVRGSKKLEETKALRRPSGPKNFPLLEKRAAADDVSSSVRARALHDVDPEDYEFKWTEASSDCKKALEKIGYTSLHLVALDTSEKLPPAPPKDSVHEGCIDFYQFAFNDAYGGSGNEPDSDDDFCNTCGNTSWVHEFGNTCGMDMINHYWTASKKLMGESEGSTDPMKVEDYELGLDMGEKALEYVWRSGLLDYYGAAGLLACYGDKAGDCAQRSWWWSYPYVKSYPQTPNHNSCPANQSTGYINTDCSSTSCPYSSYGDDCCYMVYQTLRVARENSIMSCNSKDIFAEMLSSLGDKLDQCWMDFYDSMCSTGKPGKFLDDTSDQVVECCDRSGADYGPYSYGPSGSYYSLVPACQKMGKKPGETIEEYLLAGVESGDRTSIFESSAVRAPALAVLMLVIPLLAVLVVMERSSS